MRRGQSAFTLIEILVAVVVLAVLAVAAYGGLDAIIRIREQTQVQERQFSRLQLAMLTLTRDIQQAAPRPIRHASGDTAPAMTGGDKNIPPLAFTRAGNPNPLIEPRSGLQRVGYEVVKGKLERVFFAVLDRSIEPEPERQTLLTGVTALSVRFLDDSGQWENTWPPLNAESGQYNRREPAAVEVTLDTKRWGRIRRLIEIAP